MSSVDTQTSVEDLVSMVSKQLCDTEKGFEYLLLPKEDLIQFYNCGLAVAFSGKQELFTETAEFPLQGGDCQDFGDCIAAIVSIKKVIAEDGTESKPCESDPTTADKTNNLASFFQDDCCRPHDSYLAESYNVPQTMGSEVVLQPPVPDGEGGTIVANVVRYPNTVGEQDASQVSVDSRHKPAIYEYMMYMARSRAAESEYEVRLAGQHLENALRFMGIDFRSYARLQATIKDDPHQWRYLIRGVSA